MNETQKRIKAYQDALPGIRERIVAVTLLLAMSLMMMVSASFAWLTISRAPAVMGVNTTVAANGNLEIALASGDGTTAPGDSKVGDSFAREGQTVVASNQTWGNLINLGDPAYGLENLTMRPAQLNPADLLNSPLYAAAYDSDGRITALTSDFGYASWVPPEGNIPGYFGTSDERGVRAISSMELQAVGADIIYHDMVRAAEEKNRAAGSTYVALGANDRYMPSLATMMGIYMTARMNPDDASLSNPDCAVADIQNLRDMYAAFLGAFDQEAEAIAAQANLQLFLLKGEGNYTPYTKEMIYATTTAKLKDEGIQVTALDQFIKDRNTVASDLEKLKDLCSSGSSLKWKDSGLNDIVNNLVNVGACTIGADNTPISSIGASNAANYLSGTQEARITNGILYRFEERVGAYIQVKNLSISAKAKRMGITIPATVKANIQTTAPRNYNLFNNDQTYAEGLNTGDYVGGGTYVAVDTYGLAVDLWVRTNASGSYLTLEGNVITQSEMVRATDTDINGNEVQLYTISQSVTDEETGENVTVTMDVYSLSADDGTVTWYRADDNSPLSEEELGNQEPVAKMVEKITVVGYEGENRVWDDSKQLSSDATTQGSGSCYVYYADTPEDQARSLTLLEAFNVAFVDGNGQLLCTAVMDTEHYYAQSGRVIVPLVLSASDSINLGEDYAGEVTYAITALERNVPTRVTALVYLDGTKLTNDEVLSAADIQGQLNIQFGSSKSLQPIDNEKLEGEHRRASASVSETSFNYDTHEGDMKTTVTVAVDGDEPGTVTAFFLRKISDTQGAREDTMTFSKNAEGKWVADYVFTTPGTYVLRTVRLDGVDYDLESPPTVEIKGFTVKSLSCDQAVNNHISVMTAASSSPVDVRLEFATDDVTKMPRTVQGRFLREDGSATNINFTYNSGIWTGSAAFLSSGRYSMQYLVLDGEYVELDENMWQTATVYLGMKAAVYTTSPHTIKYVPSEMTDKEKLLGMQVKIVDDMGKEMPGLSDVKLTYGMKGSGIKKMDVNLAWKGSYYEGDMQNGGPGVWQFGYVTVGSSNTIATATTAPTFTILSPEPPEYHQHSTVAYQYKPNNDAVMNVQITNSAAAQVQAYIVRAGQTEGVWVNGTVGGEYTTPDGKSANHWNFPVPKDANGYQDGNWQLTQLKLWDVFDENGKAYTQEEPLILDVPDGNVTKVVSRIMPSFAEDKSQNFGKDASGNVTASFMQEHTISGLSVDIKDFAGEALVDSNGNLLVSDVKLIFTYVNGSSSTNGGYTSDSLTNATAGATITVPLTNDGSNTHFVQTTDAKILYAGSYTTTLSFKVSGTTYTYTGSEDTDSTKALPANAPVFSVWSKAPMLTITGITPSGSNPTEITWTVSRGTPTFTVGANMTSSYSDYGATLYAVATADNSTQHHGNFTQPTLTVTVAGVPDGYTASFTLPAGSADAVVFSRTGNGTIKQALGKVSQIKKWETWFIVTFTHTLNAYYGHGEQTISTMTLTKDGVTYTVTLANPLKITNPSSANQLS